MVTIKIFGDKAREIRERLAVDFKGSEKRIIEGLILCKATCRSVNGRTVVELSFDLDNLKTGEIK